MYYQVFEHLIINEKPEGSSGDDRIKFLAQSHFSLLAMKIILDLALYGYKGKTLLRGKIEVERVTELPKDIPWQAFQTAIHLEGVTIEGKYQMVVKTSCKKLISLSSEDSYNLYEEDEEGIYCFMCMPILASRDDFKKFIHHSSVLKRHIEEDEFFGSAPYFYNQSNDEPKILYLDIKKDGSCHYYMARA